VIVHIYGLTQLVFLLGGRTKETVPTAILIRSGDVILMSGETRFSFHSVPRMIENTTPGDLHSSFALFHTFLII
jgi:alkylated DNA repair protein alkB family protein 1